MSKNGVFICIEGLDASGKTTHTRQLVRDIRLEGFDAIYTTEPSQGKIGKFIRTFLLQREKRVPSVVEALLFAADRVYHVETAIKPELQKGKIIICDRYLYSSLAYQGGAGLDLDWIKEINKNALTPDLAIYLHVPPEVVIKRIRRKKSVMERLEIQRKVEQIYLHLVKSGMMVRIDGYRPKRDVSKDILAVTLDFLKA